MKRPVLIALPSLFLVSIAVFSLIGCSGSESTLPTDPTAETIIDRMRQAYATCNTYQDTGVQNVTYSSGSYAEEKSFSTAFLRSDRFRFEYKDLQVPSQPSYIIWQNGMDVLSWWDIDPGIHTEDSLEMAIAGAYGVSNRLSGTIPWLLMPNQAGLYYIPDTQRLDDAVVDGINCYRIYYNSAGNSVTIWIDAEKYLIRRIETDSVDYGSTVVTTYNPTVEGYLSDDALAFNPPLASGDVGDRLVITNITPTSVLTAQTTTFTVEVSYTLVSSNSGSISIAGQEAIVSKGTGTSNFIVAEPVQYSSSASYFLVRVNLYGDQQRNPLAYNEKFIIVSPSGQGSAARQTARYAAFK